jgi:xylulokinase
MALLGIDIGTSGTKALVCDEDGKVLATATAEYPLLSPKPGWYEQRPSDWWAGVESAVKAAMKKARLKPTEILAIGLSGQMHGSVFLDSSNKVIRNALLWNDQRTSQQCADIESAAGGRAALIQLVANPALTGFTAPKILWLRDNEPKNFDKLRKVLLPKDYIRWCMTGEFATEVSDASGTLLLDVVKRDWSTDLLSRLGLSASLLPKVHESPEVTGVLTPKAAAALGLSAGIPVVGGAGDVAAGAIGNGVVASGMLSAIIGTSGIVFAHADKPVLDPAGRVHTMCHAVPGKWCLFGCMLSAGGSLQWYRDTFAAAESLAAKKQKKDVYELLMAQAAEAPVGSEGLTFLPYLTGERCPHPDPTAKGAWIGLTRRHGRPHMVRSVVEGVTFGLRDALEIVRGMNLPATSVRVTGGGARSPFWRQMLADSFALPMDIPTSTEGGAFGVALLAGVGAGVWRGVEEACRATIRSAGTTKPKAKSTAAYEQPYRRYASLYPVLKGHF